MEIINLEQGTQEWLDFRKNHIGASDASIIMGASKWKTTDGRVKTPRLLWAEKLGLDHLDSDNSATRYGKEMEEPARLVYQEMVGDLFEPACVKNKYYPYLMASLDGLNLTQDHAVEIKNCSAEDHALAKEGKVPAKYYPQVQMQIMVTDLLFIDYFSFHKGEAVIVKVERDNKYIAKMELALSKFWKCVETFTEPALTEDDFVEKGDEWLEKAQILYDIKQKKKELALQEKKLEETLKELSDNRNACCGDYRYACGTTIGRVDYKAIPELSNVNLEHFRSPPSSRWTLRKI